MYTVLTVASVTLLGMSAGVFYAFSSFVMSGLDRAGDQAAGESMTGINDTAVRPAFMSLFFGALVVAAVTAVYGLVIDDGGAGWVLAAAAVYLVGAFGVTAVRNVPMNNRLLAATDKAAAWHDYYRPWTAWNHVRTIASGAATVLAAIGLP
ncbi:DUF1772 domain-containing protein [Myceligenerans pegani]|uniref:DUF1772 domain-containing protein n=1 Tax=Myceligenerans pegani TaxID=2776917 RepID=A0ABR9N5A2_9MICO|nr:anthrone oxygenase family protein [Myceligenerans sp. TRM 65318]MBE1878167.1 DUF1772 domain-containing protein [Myceligenerans sp. TRM 65318]MBE3020438.1 DUF1772 domain-containing protein [Myceligenerans sp. TRM 65318]